MKTKKETTNVTVEKELLVDLFHWLRDWLQQHGAFLPNRVKSWANHDLLENVFPRFVSAASICIAFWLAHLILCVSCEWVKKRKEIVSKTWCRVLLTGRKQIFGWSGGSCLIHMVKNNEWFASDWKRFRWARKTALQPKRVGNCTSTWKTTYIRKQQQRTLIKH